MKKTYTEYKDMLCRIDDVGKDNSMASNIYECLVFSVSENAENMTEQMVSEMEGLATLTADLTELANKLSDNLEKFGINIKEKWTEMNSVHFLCAKGIIEKSNGCKYNTIKSIYDLKMGKETDIYVDDQADF